jgi:hypothetical protein
MKSGISPRPANWFHDFKTFFYFTTEALDK